MDKVFKLRKLISIAAFFFFLQASAQVSLKDSSIYMPVVYASYAVQIPGGDLTTHFNTASALGVGLQFKLKSNWTLGVEFNHLWWSAIKDADSILSDVLTSDGQLIDIGGLYAVFDVFGRGINWLFIEC